MQVQLTVTRAFAGAPFGFKMMAESSATQSRRRVTKSAHHASAMFFFNWAPK